jgi:hypothetical protein
MINLQIHAIRNRKQGDDQNHEFDTGLILLALPKQPTI